MDLGLAGRRALVLGASRGLGGATARALVAEGANVVAASRSGRTDWAADLAAEMRARVGAVSLDLASSDSCAAALDAVLAAGPVDILINNSGGPPAGPVDAVGAAEWCRQFEIMACSLFGVTSRVLPGMRSRRWGRVVTIVSSGVEQPIPGLGISNAIRAAVVGWSKTLAGEVASDGVTVNVVVPGRIQTDRVDELDQRAADRSGTSREAVATASAATIPVGRYGNVSEFANVVAFLCGAPASYMTGGKIRVDGGLVRAI